MLVASFDSPKSATLYRPSPDISTLAAFRSIDEDLTGEIDPKEFFALPQFSAFASPETMDTLFRAIDTDGSGTVTEVELLSVMFPIATKSDVQEMIKMAHRVRFGSKKEEKAKPKHVARPKKMNMRNVSERIQCQTQ